MNIREIWTYPVKSMQGYRVTEASLGPLGIAGDRIWAVRDLERGGIRGAKKLPGLMQCRAEQLPEGVQVVLPDGTGGMAGDPLLDRRLTQYLGHRVQLEPLPGAENLDHFRRGAPDSPDMLTEMRAIFGRDPEEPLPDFSVFPPEVAEFESPPGAHYDCYPLMVMTTSALASLRAVLGPSGADIRRFRPSVVLDPAGALGDAPPQVGRSAHVEFGWKGRRARLGSAEIEFLDPCPRCVMVTHHIDDQAPADRSVLRHIVAELDQNLGVYARVISAGQISVGDVVVPSD